MYYTIIEIDIESKRNMYVCRYFLIVNTSTNTIAIGNKLLKITYSDKTLERSSIFGLCNLSHIFLTVANFHDKRPRVIFMRLVKYVPLNV